MFSDKIEPIPPDKTKEKKPNRRIVRFYKNSLTISDPTDIMAEHPDVKEFVKDESEKKTIKKRCC